MGLTQKPKQIGEVSERTGLSLRTIRYYEEIGLVVPSSRTHGGFRLYSEADIARLELVRRMKPLDFSLDEMRDLLQTLDRLAATEVEQGVRGEAVDRLDMYRLAAQERCRSLRTQLESAEEFAESLRREIDDRREVAGPRP